MKYFTVALFLFVVLSMMFQSIESNPAREGDHESATLEISGRDIEKNVKQVGKTVERIGQNIARPFKKIFG